MPRSLGKVLKRGKRAKSAKLMWARRRCLNEILNSVDTVPEDAHVEYFNNMPSPEPLEPMEVEVEKNEELKLCGKRIVDINYFIKQFSKIVNHDKRCVFGKMFVSGEVRKGMMSIISFSCKACDTTTSISSHPPDSTTNKDIVWGLSSIGSGYDQGNELLSVMNTPFMEKKTFKKIEENLRKEWEALLIEDMRKNALQERQLAIEANDIEDDIPFITVIVDGGWARRSYGHSFSSLSGVACIIGRRTKKLLYLGVKNKFCYVCSTTKKQHQCFKNHSGTSTSMEQNIIVSGFSKSEEEYGLRYKYFIGDGDSSVYVKIKERVSYGRSVIKLECANHVTKCFTSGLYKIVKDSSNEHMARSIIKLNISKYTRHIRQILKGCKTENDIQEAVRNSPFKMFGKNTHNLELLQNSSVWPKIINLIERICIKADRLTHNVTTNQAERFMGIVAKFTGGKRTNLIQRGVYQNRCVGAGLSFNNSYNFHKFSCIDKEKYFLSKFVIKRHKKNLASKKYYNNQKKQKDEDEDYGSHPSEPDLPDKIFQEKKLQFLELINNIDVYKVEEDTRGQTNNINWFEARKNRITASTFGKICRRRKTTPTDNLLKYLFFKDHFLHTPSIDYGLRNEEMAVKEFEKIMGVRVSKCGFFICEENKFLGASPDGIIENKFLIEVKCLYSIRDKKIRDVVGEKKNLCVFVDDNNCLQLKKEHAYMYQIQGQLHVCKKTKCYLVLYTDVDCEILEIYLDNKFVSKMLKELILFWNEVALPELVDSRILRNLKTRM